MGKKDKPKPSPDMVKELGKHKPDVSKEEQKLAEALLKALKDNKDKK